MVAQEQNAGYAAGIAKRSAVKQIGWALKGAPMRKKDLRLNAMGAIVEGRKLRDKVTSLMNKAESDPENAMVFCVFAEQDLSNVVPELLFLPVRDGASDIKAASRHADKLPIGFLVFVMDTSDAKQPIFGHARPLIVEDARAVHFNAVMLETYARNIKRKLVEAGRIPDDSN
jgi:hypothetical protein